MALLSPRRGRARTWPDFRSRLGSGSLSESFPPATKEEPALSAADFRFDSVISSKAASTRTDACLGSAHRRALRQLAGGPLLAGKRGSKPAFEPSQYRKDQRTRGRRPGVPGDRRALPISFTRNEANDLGWPRAQRSRPRRSSVRLPVPRRASIPAHNRQCRGPCPLP